MAVLETEKNRSSIMSPYKTLLESLRDVKYPGDMYDLFGSRLFYTPPNFTYPSTMESWSTDWKNIQKDFFNAVLKLDLESSR